MVKKPDIQYIDKFYVHGSEARVLELKPKRRIIKTVLPLAAPDHTIKISVDPVALCGILVAIVMLVAMALGTVQYSKTCRKYQQMMDYVVTVQNENVTLKQKYQDSYNLADVEARALELGMVPVSEVEVRYVDGQMPQQEPEMTYWEELEWLLKGLFA